MTLDSFLSEQKIAANKFYGVYKKQDDTHGYINEIISVSEGKFLIHPDTGKRMRIGVPTSLMNLEEGAFYRFSIILAPEPIRAKTGDKYYLFLDRRQNCEKLLFNPYQDIIKQRFERLNNPDANIIIASLLREVGKGLYSSKKRMFFELLQNADDVPTSSGEVKFFLETKGDYLIVMHDGLPFDKDDVESITSAAESTKQKRQDKTGYKGIGFKSVFTDSEEVIIKSGAFCFKFDRNNERFKDFDRFYFDDREDYINYPGLRKTHQERYKSAARKFSGTSSIPWQLLPLWMDSIPYTLQKSSFIINNNVAIALKIGTKGLEDYETEIKELFDDGRFLLFLRNTSFVKFNNYDIIVRKYISDHLIKIKLDFLKNETSKLLFYSTKNFEVVVSDTLIENHGIDLMRAEEDHPTEIGEKQFYFSTKDGKKLETIPPKVAAFKTTTVSFAAPVINGHVDEEPTFKKKERFSYFYTYLPMRENRLRLPFLVNGDFIPSSNREELQGDNPWNHLLMSLIGNKLVEWVAEFATQNESQYLNLLLPNEMEAEDSDVGELVEYFNGSYLKAIEEIAFIKNEDSHPQLQSDTVLDLIGLTKVIPNFLYHEITSTGKKLPSHDINTDILKKNIFSSVAKIGYKELLEALERDDRRLALKKWMLSVPEQTLISFRKWLEKSLIPGCEKEELKDKLLPILQKLSLFSLNDDLLKVLNLLNLSIDPVYKRAEFLKISIFNINTLNQQYNLAILISTSEILPYRDILTKTGFLLTKDYSKYPKTIKVLLTKENLNNNGELLYTKIKLLSLNESYSVSEAIKLLTFIQSFGGVYYDKAITELEIFTSKEGIKLPLNAVLHNDVRQHHPTFSQFCLTSADWQILQNTPLTDAMITHDKVMELLVCNEKYLQILTAKVAKDNLKQFYKAVTKYMEEGTLKNLSGHNLAIICTSTDTNLLFITPNKVLYNIALQNLTRVEFKAVKEIIESCTNHSITLPVYEALDFITSAEIKCKDEPIVNHLKISLEVPVTSINSFIKYLKATNHKEPLFDRLLLEEAKNSYIKINTKKAEGTYQVKENKELLEYLLTIEEYKGKFFPLPAAIEDKALTGLKLMSDVDLIDFILKNAGYDCEFVQFIENQDEARKYKFLTGLTAIPLSTTDLAANFFSVKTIELIKPVFSKEQLSKAESDIISHVRNTITIDDRTREQYNLAQDVIIKSKSDLSKQYVFKLSKLIETNSDGLTLDDIEKLIPKWSSKELKILFEPQKIDPQIIQQKLKEVGSFTGYQLAFIVCYYDAGSTYAKELQFNTNNDVFNIDFLNEVKKQKAYHILPLLKCLQISNPEAIILDADLRLKGSIEEPPQWLEAWANKNENNAKFLFQAGLKDSAADLIKLRTQFQSDKFTDEWKSLIHSSKISVTEHNRTIEWLFNTLETLTFEQAKASVEFYEVLVQKSGIAFGHVLQETMQNDGTITYSFTKSATYYLPPNLGAEELMKIHDTASKLSIQLIPALYSDNTMKKLSKQLLKIDRGVIDELCIKDAKAWSNSFYQSWKYKDTYKIFITNSPFVRKDTVLGEVINLYESSDKTITHNGVYYSNHQDDQEIVFSLALSNSSHALELAKGVFSDKVKLRKRSEDGPDEPQYAAEYEAIVRDLKDLDKDVQVSKNKEALQKGLVYLVNHGFDISQAYISGYIVINVRKNDLFYTFHIHSSKGGLLFLNPYTLDNLSRPEVGVIVLYPKGVIKHFIGLDELLNNPENGYFLLRAKNTRDKEQLSKLIKASEYQSAHFIFVTSEEMRDKLFALDDIRKHNNSLENRATIDPSDF